jgi:hypothetical protein
MDSKNVQKNTFFFLFENKKSLHGYREIDENACRSIKTKIA